MALPGVSAATSNNNGPTSNPTGDSQAQSIFGRLAAAMFGTTSQAPPLERVTQVDCSDTLHTDLQKMPFFKHLTEEQARQLHLAIHHVSPDNIVKIQHFLSTNQLPEIARDLSSGSLNIPIVGARLFIEGKITEAELASLCLIDAAYTQFKTEDTVVQSFPDPTTADYKSILEKCLSLTGERLEIFQTCLRGAPKSETAFHLITAVLEPPPKTLAKALEASSRPPPTAREHAARDKTSAVFLIPKVSPLHSAWVGSLLEMGIDFRHLAFERDGRWWILIPSFSMVTAYLQAIAGPDAIQVQPVVGQINAEHLLEGLQKDVRYAQLPLGAIAPSPTLADGLETGPFDFFLHDAVYHAVALSLLKKGGRAAIRKILQLLSAALAASRCPTETAAMKYLQDRLADGDQVANAIAMRVMPSFRLAKGKLFGAILDLQRLQWTPSILEPVLIDMVVDQTTWRDVYGVDLRTAEGQILRGLFFQIGFMVEPGLADYSKYCDRGRHHLCEHPDIDRATLRHAIARALSLYYLQRLNYSFPGELDRCSLPSLFRIRCSPLEILPPNEASRYPQTYDTSMHSRDTIGHCLLEHMNTALRRELLDHTSPYRPEEAILHPLFRSSATDALLEQFATDWGIPLKVLQYHSMTYLKA